jgi:predicted acetyltransferase
MLNPSDTGGAIEMTLVVPSSDRLPSYLDAVRRGWDGESRRFGSSDAILTLAAQDPQLVFAQMQDRSAEGVRYFEDGTIAARLPALFRWLWDGEFVGGIELRLPREAEEQEIEEIGHIGYGTVEWKRGRGYATKALSLMLEVARAEGMTHVELVTDTDNIGSQRVITNNGGVFVDEFQQVERLGSGRAYRWRIDLSAGVRSALKFSD